MEFSKYNVFVEGYPQENYLTIYNMFTHKIMCVTKNSEAWSTQLRDKMLGQGILVDDQIMQQEEVLRFRKFKRIDCYVDSYKEMQL